MKKFCLLIAVFLISTVSVYAENSTEYEKLISYIDLSNSALSSVKTYADKGDYEGAVREFIDYYINRKTPVWSEMPREAGNNTSFDTTNADNIKNLLSEHNGEWISVDKGDGTINWTMKPDGLNEWMWGFNRQFQFVTLSRAYLYTGKTEYALALESQFNDWYANNPKPSSLDTSGTWRTLEAGIRIGSSMISYFNNIVMCDEVSLLTKTRILLSLHEHGEYLSLYSGTNNWLLMESKGFYSLVYMFPEFKNSQQWKNIIYNRLEVDFSNQFLGDGWQHELTPNYHIEAVKSIMALQDMAMKNGEKLPYAAQLFKAYLASRSFMGAGTFVLPLNDTHDVNQSDFMYSGASLSQSLGENHTGGFLAAASGDLYGDEDAYKNSQIFENSGYISMYGDDIHAVLEAGPSGVGGHGWMSRDKLQFILTAFGRDLLIETGGSTTYADDPLSKYTYTTPAHNTVTIDGYDQIRRDNTDFSPDSQSVLLTSDRLEYAQGIYDEKYDETKLVDVVHKRKTAFVKSEYFVVRDELSGTGNHTARQYWNFAPGKYVTNSETGIVHTDFEDGKNVMIIPVDFKAQEIYYGSTSPMRGWISTGAKILNLCYKEDFTNSLCMDAVIIPYIGSIAPDVTVTRDTKGIKIKYKNYTDIVSFNNTSFTVYRTYDDGSVETIDFNSEAEESKKLYPVIPSNGTVQAEWSGFESNGTEYAYNASAKMYGSAVLTENASQILRTDYNLSAITLRASGDGVLDINGSELSVCSEDFADYTVYGPDGGKITVKCISGEVEIDCYTFLGSGEKINMHAVRQRTAQSGSASVSSSAVSVVSADFMPVKALSAENNAYFGLSTGQYKAKYNIHNKKLAIYKNDTLLCEETVYMHSGQWYNLLIRVSSGVLSVELNGEVVLSCGCTDLENGASLINEYADIYVDNLNVNGSVSDFENKLTGSSAFSASGGMWLVEGIENQYSDMKIICSATDVLPGTRVNLMLNNSDGAQLIRNGKAVEFKDGQYSFIAENGDYYFTLKKDGTVSETVKISGNGDFYNEEEYFSENFSDNSLNGNWSYGSLFYPANGKWYMEGKANTQAEAILTLPATLGGKTVLEATVIPDDILSKIDIFTIRATGGELQTISFGKGGNIIDAVTGEILGSYVPLYENKIRTEFDFDNKTYTVYNNGELLFRDRQMSNTSIAGLWRIYAAKIWSGKSGAYISDFKISKLTEYANKHTISYKAIESEAVNESFSTGNPSLIKAMYDNGILTSAQTVSSDVLTVNETEYTLFDWDSTMMPDRKKRVCYFSLSPAFGGEGYFYQNFDSSSLGSRWGYSAGYISMADGVLTMSENTTGNAELFYTCLDNLEGRISIEAQITPETDKTAVSLFTYRGQSGGETQLISLGNDGKIYSSDAKAIGVYRAGEKNKIRVLIDTENGLYSVWNNNTLLADNITLTGTAPHVRRVYVAKIYKGNSGVEIDDFVISKNCE